MATRTTGKSPARKSAPRKAAPRKAASRTRAAGAASGDTTPVNGAVAASAPDNDAQVQATAQPQDNSGAVKSPYPAGTPTYMFFPILLDAEGQPLPETVAPIIIPKFTTLNPGRVWLWSIYDKGPLIQAFEWMKLAGVPMDIQERIVNLPDEEYDRFWDGWFGEARINQGESPR